MKKKVFICTLALLLAIMVTTAFAEADLGVRGAGGSLGLVDIEFGSTVGFGGLLELGQISPNVRLEANLDYWSKSYNSIWLGKYSISDLALGGTVKYDLGDEDSAARWYVGGGLGMHILSSDIVSTSRIGLDVLGGVRFGPSETMKYFGELRYRVVSDWTQTCVRAGAVFFFGD
jgi:opacity protein-like surface antigen